MKKRLSILIQGVPGSGKTTIGQLVADALRAAGFTVSHTDPDGTYTFSDPDLEQERLNSRCRALRAARLEIDISVKNEPRKKEDQ